jgi:hypothetical protein
LQQFNPLHWYTDPVESRTANLHQFNPSTVEGRKAIFQFNVSTVEARNAIIQYVGTQTDNIFNIENNHLPDSLKNDTRSKIHIGNKIYITKTKTNNNSNSKYFIDLSNLKNGSDYIIKYGNDADILQAINSQGRPLHPTLLIEL